MGKRPTNSPIETSTTWQDAGYDCDHCGGRVLRRTDHETGLRDRVCYQCEQCKCQWTLERRPLRVGTTPACRAAQRERAAESEEASSRFGPWLLAAVVVALLLVVLRFSGGAGFVRAVFVVMPLIVGVAAVIAYGRHRGWW
jgi:hypothetical protein